MVEENASERSVRQAANLATSHSIMEILDEVFEDAGEAEADAEIGSSGSVVRDLGQIHEMVIPPGFSEGAFEAATVGDNYYKDFRASGSPEAKICLYYRGVRTGKESARAFREILDKPAHTLAPTEIDAVRETLGQRGRPKDFDLQNAQTRKINGKLVLVVEGRWKQIQEDTVAILIDSDGTGSAIQEVFYQAPVEIFPTYRQAVKQFLKSIKWR